MPDLILPYPYYLQENGFIKYVMDHPDWAPPGGTSWGRYNDLLDAYLGAFIDALVARVADRPEIQVERHHLRILLGWRDDPDGSYSVDTGLKYNSRLPEKQLRAFAYLTYSRYTDDGPLVRDDRNVGLHEFPPPYAHDIMLHVDHVLIWLDAHRRMLGLNPSAAPTADDRPAARRSPSTRSDGAVPRFHR